MRDGISRLWQKAQQGDPDACAQLLAQFHQPIYAYLRRLSRSVEEAEDLTQETFAKVWRARSTLDRTVNFKAWIYRIAYNAYLDGRQKTPPTESRPDDWWAELPSHDRSHALIAADRDLAEQLWRAVEQLEEDKRVTMHLHYYQGLSLRETAQALNVAASTVRYRLRAAIQLLRARLWPESAASHSLFRFIRREKRP